MENYRTKYLTAREGVIKILLEKGEFIRDKKTKGVLWIENINRWDKSVVIGKMDYVDNKYIRLTEIVPTFEEFYERFEDI